MNRLLKQATVAFASGALGGLANSLAVWVFGVLGISAALGVAMAPALTPSWLYPRLVWGGIWGALLLIPLARMPLAARAAIYSLGPTLVQLFIIFPFRARKGMMGIELGLMTPLLVLVFNFVWGLVATWWFRFAGGRA